MEILWVDFFMNTVFNAAAENFDLQLYSGSPVSAVISFENPKIVASQFVETNLLTSGAFEIQMPIKYDLQTTDGHGLLYAGDTLNFAVGSTGTGITNVGKCRMFYRFREVTTLEYVGIVQSLQSA